MDVKQKQIFSKEQELTLITLVESIAKPGCKFLEVGSWCGDSAVILGKIAQNNGGHLFCIDWWKGNIGTELMNIAEKNDIFSLFWKNICSFGLEDVVIPIRGRSDIAAAVLKEQTFDLVFLDGDHRFEATLNDIKEYAPLVRKGNGILCGHDCDGYVSDFDRDLLEKGKNSDVYKGIHCGVVLAVGTAFKKYSIDHNIWSVRLSSGDLTWRQTNLQFPVPQLLETYNRFNLVRYRNSIYAIDTTVGSVDLVQDKEILNKYQECGKCIVGKSIEEVKQLIEQVWRVEPRVIEEGYKQFNIIRYKDKHYALAQSLGHIDLTQTKEEELQTYQEQGKCIIANSFKEAQTFIDQLTTFFVPKLIEERYRGFNIVHYKNKYYAVSQELGPIDFYSIKESEIAAYQKQEKCFIGNSFYEAKYLLEQKCYQQLQQELAKKKENIELLRAEISSCTAVINKLSLNIEEENEQIGKLQKDIVNCNEKIAVSEKEIVQKEKNISKLNTHILENNKHIEILKKEISYRDDSIGKLNADIAALNKKMEALQKEALERDNNIEWLKRELKIFQEKYKRLAEDMKVQSEYFQDRQRILYEIQSMGFLNLIASKLSGRFKGNKI